MKIRPATAQDQTTITTMVRGAHLNPMDLRWRHFLVAEDESGIVGVGQVRPHAGAPELASLVVRAAWRGSGVGRQLVQALIARSPGPLYLFCRAQLESYYAQFGFHAITVQEAPRPLKLQYAVGRLATRLLAGRALLAMKR